MRGNFDRDCFESGTVRMSGGLMMIYDMYPGVPLKNAKALMDAREKYAFYYS